MPTAKIEKQTPPAPAANTFAANVRHIMSLTGMTVTELASKADIDRTGLSRLLTGKSDNCSLQTAQKVAAVLKTPLWQLLMPKQ